MRIKIPESWRIPEQEVTPEDIYVRRREFLSTSLKLGSAAMAAFYGFSPSTKGWSAEFESSNPSPSAIEPQTFCVGPGFPEPFFLSRGDNGIQKCGEFYITR